MRGCPICEHHDRLRQERAMRNAVEAVKREELRHEVEMGEHREDDE